jgi:hypothetical protein
MIIKKLGRRERIDINIKEKNGNDNEKGGNIDQYHEYR